MIELKVPENDDRIQGWVVHFTDEDFTKFVGTDIFFNWNHRNVIFHLEDRRHFYLIRDIVRVERVQFSDSDDGDYEKFDVLEAFSFSAPPDEEKK